MLNSLNSILPILRPMMVEYTDMTPEDDELLGGVFRTS